MPISPLLYIAVASPTADADEDDHGGHQRALPAHDGDGVDQQAGDEGDGRDADQHAVLEEVVDREGTQQQDAREREADEDALPVGFDEAANIAVGIRLGRGAGSVAAPARGVFQSWILLQPF
jgi:hypothetical protein